MFEILKSSLPLLLISLVGYGAAKFKFFGDTTLNRLNNFVFFIGVPIQMFLQAWQNNISRILQPDYIISFILSTLLMAIITYYYMRKFFPQRLSTMALVLGSTSQVNSTYLAIPLFTIFLGNALAVIPVMLYQGIVSTAATLIMIEVDLNRQKNVILSTRATAQMVGRILLTTPVIGASVLGIILGYHEIYVPPFMLNIEHILNFITSPILFFTLGLSLGILPISIRESIKAPEMRMICFLKNIVHPLVAYGIGKWIFNLNGIWLLTLVMMAAQPAARNIFTFSQRYGLQVQKFNTILIFTTLISFIFLNILLMLCGRY